MTVRLDLTKDCAEAFVSQLPKGHKVRIVLDEILRFGAKNISVDTGYFEVSDLKKLYAVAKKQAQRGLMMLLSQLIDILNNVEEAPVLNLKTLDAALIKYFTDHQINGWVYTYGLDGMPVPFLIKSIRYIEDRGMYGSKPNPHVEIKLVANGRNEKNSKTDINIFKDDLFRKSIPQILTAKKLFVETKELMAMYNEHVAKFHKLQPRFSQQFIAKGTSIEDSEYENHWRREEVVENNFGFKCVNDEEIADRDFEYNCDNEFWTKRKYTGFDIMPFHCYMYMFNLETHQQVWVHVANVEPYVYSPELVQKIVLPAAHRDLLEILVQDMDVLTEDVVRGKGGGTTILCHGKPGLGKTLTAELFSEYIERPLYRVQAGQLGTTPKQVEENLDKVLKRAERWGAPTLIDECDVFVYQRGTNLMQNAIVTSFNIKLEYFHGLLFLMTNRGEKVDDAIISRCIAQIEYKQPSANEREAIWIILSKQFGLDLGEELPRQLAERFPGTSGRDIKELLKLTSKYVRRKNLDFNVEVFRQMAQFRSISYVEEGEVGKKNVVRGSRSRTRTKRNA
jgi:hypothetical protein